MLEKEGKYIFGVCKIGEKGQIVIPKEARKLYNLSAGETLLLLGDEKGMALIKTEVFTDLAEGILNDKQK
jgi:AbrB family looped-hinge helix DNA binding protein